MQRWLILSICVVVSLIFSIGDSIAGPITFNSALPVDVAVNAKGLVYVVDQYHHRIQIFSPDGHFMNAWGGKGKMLGQFNGPTGLAIHPTGQIYITDWGNHRIQRLLLP